MQRDEFNELSSATSDMARHDSAVEERRTAALGTSRRRERTADSRQCPTRTNSDDQRTKKENTPAL